MGTGQDDSTTLSKGEEEGDGDRACRVIPGADFDQMIRNGQQRKIPPGARHAPPTVANLFAGNRPPPAFHEVVGAFNSKDRPSEVGIPDLTPERLDELTRRLQRSRNARVVRVLGIVAFLGVIYVLLAHSMDWWPFSR